MRKKAKHGKKLARASSLKKGKPLTVNDFINMTGTPGEPVGSGPINPKRDPVEVNPNLFMK